MFNEAILLFMIYLDLYSFLFWEFRDGQKKKLTLFRLQKFEKKQIICFKYHLFQFLTGNKNFRNKFQLYADLSLIAYFELVQV